MIDRKKVLSGLECHRNGFCFACPYNDDVIETTNCKRQLVEDAIELMKSQPEQKPGHWIRSSGFLSKTQCSVCKETYVGDFRTFNFCPNCGVKMDEGVKQDD